MQIKIGASRDEIETLIAEMESAREAHEEDPTDGDKHMTYVNAMQTLADANREWRKVEEEEGRRVPGVIAEVND